jgi:hypothetical protein
VPILRDRRFFLTCLSSDTLKVDATREVLEHTTTEDGGVVYEQRYECTLQKDGTSICIKHVVGVGGGVTSTSISTYTGTRIPWATITNVEASLPVSDEDSGVNRKSARTGFLAVVAASIGLGAILVMA